MHFTNTKIPPRTHISRIGFYNKEDPYIVRGFICNESAIKYGKTVFLFRVEEIEFNRFKQNVSGDILVYAQGARTLLYGENLVLSGSLAHPYLKNRNAHIIMRLKAPQDLIRLNKNSGFVIKKFALWLKSKIEDKISQYTSLLTYGVLDAMLLGEKKNIPPLLYKSMMQTGTVHILVVSGFNVGIVGFVIFLLLKFFRIPRSKRLIIVMPFLLIYCLMTGSSPPVVRATIMAIFFIIGALTKREPDVYNSLALAALFILAINPEQLFDISFQLSFASVIAIVWLYPKIHALFKVEKIKNRFVRFFLDGFLVSLSAWVGTAGFIAYYFRAPSLIAIPANILIAPLAGLITLAGLSLLLISLVCPYLVPVFASSCELLVNILLVIQAFFAKM